MIHTRNIRVDVPTAYDKDRLLQYLSSQMSLKRQDISAVRIVRRSVDARQRNIMVELGVEVYVGEQPAAPDFSEFEYKDVEKAPQAIVVGAGPAGLFAALRLIELGIKPVVLERGKDVGARKRDIALLARQGKVDEDSNYCFGEGGAGAFSDGKLYTRSKKRGDNMRILKIFCQNGASTDILVDAHPHIGSDKLPVVVSNIRKRILNHGGEVHFSAKVTSIKRSGDKVTGVRCADGREFDGPVILATGHSARDVYKMLDAGGFLLQPKGIAVGVRLEHPQVLIDRLRYHAKEGRGKYLPAAEYNFSTQVDGRGVYSFCMCPGGFVIPASTENDALVVNGMSASARSSEWANSGMVVEIRPEDIPGDGIFRLMDFQEQMERKAFGAGGGNQIAPAQRMMDFVNRKVSSRLLPTSYVRGLSACDFTEVLPPFVESRLRNGFLQISMKAQSFLTNDAQLIGVETRTSSPLRIVRTDDGLQQEKIRGLFPSGEGAGYAGGIVSAAIDGERCAESLAKYLNS